MMPRRSPSPSDETFQLLHSSVSDELEMPMNLVFAIAA